MYRESREAAVHRAEAALSRLRERGGEAATEGRFVDDTFDEAQLAELTAWAEAAETRLRPAKASAPPDAKKLDPSDLAHRRFGEALDRALTLERKIRQARPHFDRAARRLAIAPKELDLVRPRLGDVKTSDARVRAASGLLAECERVEALLQRLEPLLEKRPPVVTRDAFQVEASALVDASFRATRTPRVAHVATWAQPWKWIVAGFAGPIVLAAVLSAFIGGPPRTGFEFVLHFLRAGLLTIAMLFAWSALGWILVAPFTTMAWLLRRELQRLRLGYALGLRPLTLAPNRLADFGSVHGSLFPEGLAVRVSLLGGPKGDVERLDGTSEALLPWNAIIAVDKTMRGRDAVTRIEHVWPELRNPLLLPHIPERHGGIVALARRHAAPSSDDGARVESTPSEHERENEVADDDAVIDERRLSRRID